MNIFSYSKSVLCAFLLLISNSVFAEWTDIPSNIEITKSRPAFDRVNRVYFVYLTVKNTGTSTLNGPFRVLVDNATIPVTNQSGNTESGVPFVDITNEQMTENESIRVRVDFLAQRKALTFDVILQANKITHTVTAIAEQGGTITPNEQTVAHGETALFTATPNTSYIIDTVTGCNGSLIGNTYTTGSVIEGCIVDVSFKIDSNKANLTLISLNARSENAVEVVWVVNLDDADFQKTKFNVYFSENPIKDVAGLTANASETGKYQTIVNGLIPNTEYYVAVTANVGSNTVISEIGNIKTANAAVVPTQTKVSNQTELNLTAENVEANTLVLGKTAKSQNPEVGQIIYNAEAGALAEQKNYFRKVKKVTEINDTLQIETEPATVAKVFNSAEFNSQFKLFDPISSDTAINQNATKQTLTSNSIAYYSTTQVQKNSLVRSTLMKQAGLLVVETQYSANSPNIKKQIDYSNKVQFAQKANALKNKAYKNKAYKNKSQVASLASNNYVTIANMPETLTGKYNESISFTPQITLKNIHYYIQEVKLTLSNSSVNSEEDNYGATFTLTKNELTQKVGVFSWNPKEVHAITQGEAYKATLTVILKEISDCGLYCSEKTVTQTTEIILAELSEQRDGDLVVHLPTISQGRINQPKELEFTIDLNSEAIADEVKITNYQIMSFTLNGNDFSLPTLSPEYSQQITALPNGKVIWTPNETQLAAFKKVIDDTGEAQPFILTLKVNAKDTNCSVLKGDWCNEYETEIEAQLYIEIDLKLDSGTQTIPIYNKDGIKLAVDYNIGFKPTLDVGVEISAGEINSAKLILAGQFDFGLTAYAEINKSFQKEYKTGDMTQKDSNGDAIYDRPPLFKKQYYKVYYIGTVPVVQRIDFEVNAKITFNANAAVSMEKSYTYNKYFKTGLAFDGKNWQKINEDGTSSSLSFKLKAAADATFTVELVPQVSTTFYEVATAGLALEPELMASLSINGIFQGDDTTNEYFYNYRLSDATVKYNVAVTGWLDLSFFQDSIYHYPENINERATIWQYPEQGNVEQETNAILFSLPSLAMTAEKPQGASINLTVDITDGRYAFGQSTKKNNPFNPHANPWQVFKVNYNNGATGSQDTLIPINSTIENQEQAVFTGELGNIYTIYFTGNDDVIGKLARNYTAIELDYTDNDHDGLPLIWETQYCLPYNSGAEDDPDDDGLTNIKEYQLGTLPNSCTTNSHASQDSDNDGIPDGWEVKYGLNPLLNDADQDPDNDGISNIDEYKADTPPTTDRTDLTLISITGSDEVNANSSVQYTVTASYSDGSTKTIDALWMLPTNSAVSISTSGAITVGELTEDAVIELTAETQGLIATKTITLKAPLPNQAPIANAGTDQSVTENTTVTLNGSTSADLEDDASETPLVFSWAQTDNTGITIALSDNTLTKPTFSAPSVTESTVLEFTLTVTDSNNDTSTDIVLITVNGTPTSDISAGLVAYYPFDGDANDYSGNGHNGAENGGITYVEGVSGLSVSFDGNYQNYIRVPHHEDLNIKGDYTFSYWVNRSSDSGAQFVISKGRDCNNSYYSAYGGKLFDVTYGNSWCDGNGASSLFNMGVVLLS